jgi:hypothetical protein
LAKLPVMTFSRTQNFKSVTWHTRNIQCCYIRSIRTRGKWSRIILEELKGPLPCSQKPASGPHPETGKYSQYPYTFVLRSILYHPPIYAYVSSLPVF